jgi:glycosyltransferase involved in cell wall biosynthesis
VHLNIIGRPGWGPDAEWLAQQPHVQLLGPLPDRDARAAIEAGDFLICTSRDEGLGLPLLEVQHGGVPVIAPNMPVFREVLGRSGLFVDAADPVAAADAIARLYASPGWRVRSTEAALANVARWNALAANDHAIICRMFEDMLGLERPIRDTADAVPAPSRAA